MITTIKGASLETAVEFLRDLKARQIDLVSPIGRIAMRSGQLLVEYESQGKGKAVILQPTDSAVGQIAEKIGIPVAYLRKMLATGYDGPRLADENFNFWAQLEASDERARNFFLRGYLEDDGTTGILRAILSDRYKSIENLTLLGLTLESVLQTGMNIRADEITVGENRMYARFSAPEIGVTAKDLLGKFEDPNGGQFGGTGIDNGIVMGFTISNSETGHGKVEFAPRVKILACANGLMYDDDSFAKVHLGAKLSEGEQLSEALKEIESEFITQQLKESIQNVVNKDYLGKRVKELRELKKIKITKPLEVLQGMGSEFSISDEKIDEIFSLFTAINQMADESPNAWQVSQAFTTWAHRQTAEEKVMAEVLATPDALLPFFEN